MEERESRKSSLLVSLFFSIVLSSCVTSAPKYYKQQSTRFGFSESRINTGFFDLVMYEKKGGINNDSLHIYIEGDGRPFIHHRYPSKDPTSRNTLMLELMALDNNHSVLLSRPCYHGDQSSNCKNSKWWTSHRYSQTVVNEMSKAIRQLNPQNKKIVLIGFSGGGTLAMLLSPRIARLSHIYTISANLDINAWTAKHQYTPLRESLNPIDYLEQTKDLPQTHLVGLKDSNIPYQAWLSKIDSGQNTTIFRYPEYSHTCCWNKVWKDLINQPH